MEKKSFGNNVSEKYGFIWVAPERTGSRKVAEILTYYGFTNNGNKIFNAGEYSFSHYYNSSENNNDYPLICNVRNPYARTYAVFKNYYHKIQDKSKDNFKRYLFKDVSDDITKNIITNPILTKKPSHIIRLEYLFEDLIKLPFIFDVLTESQLKMLCLHGKPLDDWEQYYDQETKELVFDLTKHHFYEWGYEK